MCKIIVLYENNPSENKSLKTGHGLSFFVDIGTHSILFDCGPDASMVYNCARLGICLDKIDFTVLSHNHYDHSGGFIDAHAAGLNAPLITGKNFFEKKYAYDGIKFTALYSALSEQFVSKNAIVHKTCGTNLTICNSCTAVGHFVSESRENIPRRMVKGLSNPPVADTFTDEICVVLETKNGLAVLVGCSHPGILSMLKTVSERLNKSIYAVLGGAHLAEADEERLEYTAKEMKALGIKIFGLNHCSGSKISQVLRKNGIVDCALNTGDLLVLQ